MRSPLIFASTLLALSLPTLLPRPAHACGGTFCDIGPNVMPVDQSGENILFWIDESGGEPHTEAHIQIQYEGDAERFAWIVPVQQVPEVLVGNQALFDSLLAATVPVFTVTTNVEPCDDDASVGLCGADESANFQDDGGGFDEVGGSEDGNDTNGVEILDRGFAGAFEYVTLTGTSVDEVVDWLDMAGYAQDDEAPPILQEYLDEGFVFVAFKLRGGADVDEIHPLAIRYPGTEPCIPIRLTRIAAVDDMAIRAFFLGTTPVAPQNWPHVVVNPAALDWAGDTASSYLSAVSLAVDEAGGRAFVSEYVGTSAIVSTSNVDSPLWNPTAFEAIEPVMVYDVLVAQGLGIECDEFGTVCEFAHPQVEPLLQIYLPAPDGVDAYEFWQNLEQYADQIDLAAWSGPGFATAFAERISTPGEHAKDMLAASTMLTRLFTLLSPHEMTEDPLFHPAEDLPLVDMNWSGTQTLACESNDWVTLPDGRDVTLTGGGTWPSLDGMPYAERIEQVPTMGPPQVTTDNRALIDELIAKSNASKTKGPQPGCAVDSREAEPVLALLAVFGIAGLQRRRRRG